MGAMRLYPEVERRDPFPPCHKFSWVALLAVSLGVLLACLIQEVLVALSTPTRVEVIAPAPTFEPYLRLTLTPDWEFFSPDRTCRAELEVLTRCAP
jgi:hypothetical protein